MIDEWVGTVAEDAFDDLLPLLRRAFARYEKAERRMIGEQLKRGAVFEATAGDFDATRAVPAVAEGRGITRADLVTRDRLTRWRLILGGDTADGIGGVALDAADQVRDAALEQLYDESRRGGLGRSSPRVARWLGDIRTYFPSSVVQVMQRDAMERLGLRQLLLEPELLEAVEPDIDLATTLIGLGGIIPEHSRGNGPSRRTQGHRRARSASRRVDCAAIIGALNRSARTTRPRHSAIDWHRTVTANLKHYQPEHRTVIPERLVGYARRNRQIDREIILCIDQSGSMAQSVVYASVFGAVMASVRSVDTASRRIRYRDR